HDHRPHHLDSVPNVATLQPGQHLIGRQRTREVGALPAVAADPQSGIDKLLIVQTFRGGPHTQGVDERNRGTHERGPVDAAVGEPRGERLVQPDLVQGQPGELSKSEVPGTKTFQGQTDPDLAQPGDGLATRLRFDGQGVFTDLQDQAVGGQPVVPQGGEDGGGQCGVEEVACAQTDRDGQVLAVLPPPCDLGQGDVEDLPGEGTGQVGL